MSRVADPNRRKQIIEAARRAFREQGFEGAHMSDVARRANIAVGTLYLYFESKEAIASAIAAELFADASAAILPLFERKLTPRRIAAVVDRTFDAVFADQSFGRTGIPMSDVSATMAPDAFAAVVSKLTVAFEKQMHRGDVRHYDAATLADYFVILVRRAVLLSAEDGREREPYAKTLKQFLTAALMP